MKIVIGKHEDYPNITSALNDIKPEEGEEIEIRLTPGIYDENLVIRHPNLTLIGEDAERTIIRGNDYAPQVLPDGTKRGTFDTATIRTDADHILLKNLTIANTAGMAGRVGQALALYADGDDLRVTNCRLLGHQDTIFTAPLPPVNGQGKNEGFGPKQEEPRTPSRQYYSRCYIEGDVDFIFGGAMALFEDCTLYSHKRSGNKKDGGIQGYVSAPSTPKGQPYGYLFVGCRFESDCPEETVLLSRPWRNDAKSVIVRSYIGGHIKAEGYFDWNKPEARLTSWYAEGSNEGPGADRTRVDWAHKLDDAQVESYVQAFRAALIA